MSIRVFPDTEENEITRFRRASSWIIPPLQEETTEDVQLKILTPDEEEVSMIPLSDRVLHYFKWLSKNTSADINWSYLNELIENGADINAADRDTSETVLHVIAGGWDMKLAEFVLSKGAWIDSLDIEGRTPLHIAAYCNHSDMVTYLLDKGAEINRKSNEGQTSVHYAVRASSIDALQILIDRGAIYDTMESVDIHGRTPVYLGAELDRTEAVDFLLSLEKPARCDVDDSDGHSALVIMIYNMPEIVNNALGQFHKVFAAERRQEYLLSRIESRTSFNKTPFEAAVEENAIQVLVHPVMRKLVDVKWNKLAKWYFGTFLGIYFLFLAIWTILILLPAIQDKHIYYFPYDIWRIVLGVLGVALLIYYIIDEVCQYINSYKHKKSFYDWFGDRMSEDLKHCQGIYFEEEREFIEQRLAQLQSFRSKFFLHSYFQNSWNYIDITTYALLSIVVILHIFDVLYHSDTLALWTARIGGIAITFVWARLLYFARASVFLGSMIAIIGQLSGNFAQYFMIFAVFYFPYVVNFWLFFGGNEQTLANVTEPSEELTKLNRIFVVLFRMSIIDDYPYQAIRDTDEITATTLVISFMLIHAVIGLNLFIALLSDTFQRVYDNANANAELQKAHLILSLEKKLHKKLSKPYLKYIREHCNPTCDYYDDDDDVSDSKSSVKNLVKELTKRHKDVVTQGTKLSDKMDKLSEKIAVLVKMVEEMKTSIESKEKPPSLEGATSSTTNKGIAPVASKHRSSARSTMDQIYRGHRRIVDRRGTIYNKKSKRKNNSNDNNSSIV